MAAANKINWQKGFFRLWAVFTVLWMLGMGVVVWSDAPRVMTWRTYGLTPEGTLSVVDDANSFIQDAYSNGSLEKRELDSGAKAVVQGKWTEARKLAQTAKVDRLVMADLSRRRTAYYRKTPMTFALAATVPIGLLCMGFLVGWIISGFRRHDA